MATTTSARGRRLNADERRDQVLDAAIHEFAEHGYQGARTAAIAARAGISQPYIYALFEDKRELFCAASERVCERVRAAFGEAAKGGGGSDEKLARMGDAYTDLLGDRDVLRCMLQGFAASGDERIRRSMRDGFQGVIDDVARLSGADDEAVRSFMAYGMYLNVHAVLELDGECA